MARPAGHFFSRNPRTLLQKQVVASREEAIMVYMYLLDESVSAGQAESRMFLAAVNAENIFGEAQMRLDAKFRYERHGHVAWIDANTEVGKAIAKLFISYISTEFGGDACQVRHVEAVPED
jgi:hypothetical protein